MGKRQSNLSRKRRAKNKAFQPLTQHTMETKKQEAIRLAYGNHWEKLKKYVDNDGLLSKMVFSKTGVSYEEVSDIDFIHYGITTAIPKSLQNIETNNGWISIESEEDLPKGIGMHEYVVDGKVSDHLMNSAQIKICWQDGIVSHYKTVQKSQPPIF